MYQVLLVDDEPLILSGIKFMLDWNKNNCQIAGTARNGQQAMEKIRTLHPDIVICDIAMPGMTGTELLQQAAKEFPHVVFIMLTNHPDFQLAQHSLRYRAVDYLLKPYNEQELVFAVEEAIRQVSVQLPARPLQAPVPEEPVRREEDGDMRTAIIRAEISSFIDAHYREDISMQDAAAALRYSDAYFCKLFKQCFRVNFSAYLNEYRVNRARQLMLDPRLNMKDIGAAVGYSDANYFTRVFKRLTGQTPSEYRMAAAEKAVQG